MFGGVQELTIDTKGRLAIPAKFKEVLLRHHTPELVITLEKRSQLLLYPVAQWRRVEADLLKLPTMSSPVLKKFQALVLGHAETIELDNAGRILLPQSLRKLVEFDRDVTLVGRANRMELWGRERWDMETAAALDLDEDLLAEELSKTTLCL